MGSPPLAELCLLRLPRRRNLPPVSARFERQPLAGAAEEDVDRRLVADEFVLLRPPAEALAQCGPERGQDGETCPHGRERMPIGHVHLKARDPLAGVLLESRLKPRRSECNAAQALIVKAVTEFHRVNARGAAKFERPRRAPTLREV